LSSSFPIGPQRPSAPRRLCPPRARAPLPPPSRTNWTRLVPPPVLTGHVSSQMRAGAALRSADGAGAEAGDQYAGARGRCADDGGRRLDPPGRVRAPPRRAQAGECTVHAAHDAVSVTVHIAVHAAVVVRIKTLRQHLPPARATARRPALRPAELRSRARAGRAAGGRDRGNHRRRLPRQRPRGTATPRRRPVTSPQRVEFLHVHPLWTEILAARDELDTKLDTKPSRKRGLRASPRSPRVANLSLQARHVPRRSPAVRAHAAPPVLTGHVSFLPPY